MELVPNKAKITELTPGNSADLIFQGRLIRTTDFREDLESNSFSLYACTENSNDNPMIFTITFQRNKPLIAAYSGTVSTSMDLPYPSAAFTLLQGERIGVVADLHSMVHGFRMAQGKAKPEVSVNAGSSRLVAFFKEAVGKHDADCSPVAVGTFGDTGIVLVHSNSNLTVWDLKTRSQLGKTLLPTFDDKPILHAMIEVKQISHDCVLIAVAYASSRVYGMSLAAYRVSLPLAHGVLFAKL